MARRALLKLTSPQTMSNPSAAVAWDVAIEDTSSFFSSGDPTRLTVGPNISAVRLYGGAYMTSAVGEPGGIYLQKNGAPFYGAAAQLYPFNDASVLLSIVSPEIPVVEGDYFEFGRGATSGQLEAAEYTYFGIEAV